MAVNKVYEPIGFVNGKNGGTPLNGATTKQEALEQHIGNLNKMDYALNEIDNRVVDIANSRLDSQGYATESQSYAVGGTDTREGENTDNAKYYAEQAQRVAQDVGTDVADVIRNEMQGYVADAEKQVGYARGFADNAEYFAHDAGDSMVEAKNFADQAKASAEEAKSSVPDSLLDNVTKLQADVGNLQTDLGGIKFSVVNGILNATYNDESEVV